LYRRQVVDRKRGPLGLACGRASIDAMANAYDCPRCGTSVEDELYGPCRSCRTELRARFAGEARDVIAADYEPKMNVTPNAVALKE
jgi:hypothetical protein